MISPRFFFPHGDPHFKSICFSLPFSGHHIICECIQKMRAPYPSCVDMLLSFTNIGLWRPMSAFFFYLKVFWGFFQVSRCEPTSFSFSSLFLKVLQSSLEVWYWIICWQVFFQFFFIGESAAVFTHFKLHGRVVL